MKKSSSVWLHMGVFTGNSAFSICGNSVIYYIQFRVLGISWMLRLFSMSVDPKASGSLPS